MRVKMHQPAKGVQPGDIVDVPKAEGDWLTAMGYASVATDEQAEARSDDNSSILTPEKRTKSNKRGGGAPLPKNSSAAVS